VTIAGRGHRAAIGLAAARVRLLPPHALASRLDQRFSLLTSGPVTWRSESAPLRNTLDWSFGLLSASEQALIAKPPGPCNTRSTVRPYSSSTDLADPRHNRTRRRADG
jgi:hypothetical protein